MQKTSMWSLWLVAVVVAACGTPVSGGGGGGGVTVAVNGFCASTGSASCAGLQPVTCVQLPNTVTPTWQATGPQCGAGEYCQVDPTGKSASCKSNGSSVSDAGGTGGGGASDAGGASSVDFAQVQACLQTKCSTAWTACQGDAKCAAGWACVKACKVCDVDCYAQCGVIIGENAAYKAMGTCSDQAACLPKLECPYCGNNKCEAGETATSCPNDCGGGGGGGQPVCGNGTCDSGESPASCPADCKPASSCGNGKCDSGESPASCPADCKQSNTAVCGDTVCAATEEASCPVDCDATYAPAIKCVATGCGAEWAGCVADPKCVGLFNCMAACACDKTCLDGCTKALGGAMPSSLQAMSNCNAANSCQDPCASAGGGGSGTPGCAAITASKGGCDSCGCEAAVCAMDSWCCPAAQGGKGWDDTCAKECAQTTPGYCQ
jgi:hypothetical protein